MSLLVLLVVTLVNIHTGTNTFTITVAISTGTKQCTIIRTFTISFLLILVLSSAPVQYSVCKIKSLV